MVGARGEPAGKVREKPCLSFSLSHLEKSFSEEVTGTKYDGKFKLVFKGRASRRGCPGLKFAV